MSNYDWVAIRKRLRAGRWYLLDTSAPYTTAEAIRSGSIRVMADVEVRTRENVFDDTGKRWCTIYLKLKE